MRQRSRKLRARSLKMSRALQTQGEKSKGRNRDQHGRQQRPSFRPLPHICPLVHHPVGRWGPRDLPSCRDGGCGVVLRPACLSQSSQGSSGQAPGVFSRGVDAPNSSAPRDLGKLPKVLWKAWPRGTVSQFQRLENWPGGVKNSAVKTL
jgi:hypothetical protein